MLPEKQVQKGMRFFENENISIGRLFLLYCYLSSIRAQFGTNEQKNAVHGSDSAVSAEREIRFFFPNCKLNKSFFNE